MILLDGIQLPPGLVWVDEFAAGRVAQTARRTLDGSLVVFYGQFQAGLPITLESEIDAGWLTRAQVEAVAIRAASPGGIYTLQLRDQTMQVMFRHQDAPAFEARPLVPVANPRPTDYYLATIKLMTV
ncbi:hypothetical protein [Sulfurivermis fontis]|uniref:hypothetical protein n=1 Tax=Sulfurivermis fontis TaxID=1972068 RepID=UPI000FD87727|nr:hypothetical protein [Sulfurivermis fontis]